MILSDSGERLKILAIVPARGGSKGIKNKNIKLINGFPLIYYTAKIIEKIKMIDKSVVSSDSLKIIKIAKKYGLEAPFIRPKKISGDNVHDIDVLKHALETCEKNYKDKFDIVLMLQPTSPVRKKKMIIEAIKKISSKESDSVWSISKIDLKFNPKKQLKISKDGYLDYCSKDGRNVINRQMLDETFIRTGQIYAIKSDLIRMGKMYSKKTSFVLEKNFFANIDSLNDLKEAENYLIKNKIF